MAAVLEALCTITLYLFSAADAAAPLVLLCQSFQQNRQCRNGNRVFL